MERLFGSPDSPLAYLIIFSMFIALVAYNVVNKRLGKLLSDMQRQEVKGLIPTYVWLPVMLTWLLPNLLLLRMIQPEFLRIVSFGYMVLTGAAFSIYRRKKIKQLQLPDAYMKATTEIAKYYRILGLTYFVFVFVWAFEDWSRTGYAFFRT